MIKFEIFKTSMGTGGNQVPHPDAYKENGFWYIEFFNLEEFTKFVEGCGEPVIIDKPHSKPMLEIYDFPRER